MAALYTMTAQNTQAWSWCSYILVYVNTNNYMLAGTTRICQSDTRHQLPDTPLPVRVGYARLAVDMPKWLFAMQTLSLKLLQTCFPSGLTTPWPLFLQFYKIPSIPTVFRRHEQAKKREYRDRIREVECASFTPLVFATTGGMGREATAFYKRLADLISTYNNSMYSTTMAWIRCTLSSLLRSAVMCMRGSRSSSHWVPDASLELGVAESRLSY